MTISRKEIKYIALVIIILIAILSRVEIFEQKKSIATKQAQEKITPHDNSPIECDEEDSYALSSLLEQPQDENSCLNIGCGSFF